MKNTIKVSALALALASISGSAIAATTGGTASATILKGLTGAKVADIGFGDMLTGTGGSGSATVSIADNGSRSITAGGSNVSLSATDAGARGEFTISGTASQVVDVSVDSPSLTGPGTAMTTALAVSNGTATITNATLDGSGNSTVYIKGDLTVAHDQTDGAYSGNYTVTFNYQ